jgi:uncharacterized protein with ParB-like and HNH nuclease domain
MKKIDGIAKTIRGLLSDQRYSIDYYQREYRWQRKQLQELISDLTEQFLSSYSPEDERRAVQGYEHYFLGSVILSKRDNEVYIVDGQQRLTTLTLLLIYLHNLQGNRTDRVKLEDMIFAEKYGTKSFNIAVPERTPCMDAIFSGQDYESNNHNESVQNIVARYQDLTELFPEELEEDALPYFADWLIENVHLVEITATTDEDAYTVFETMNDRGLSLSPLDMLKGYLLSNISDTEKRKLAARVWRDRIEVLRNLGKDEDSDAVKNWLRARYAQSVRERSRGAENKDFERIGTEFHRWVGEHSEVIGLNTSDDYFRFVHREFDFYTRQYERLRQASTKQIEGLEPVYHVSCFNFTLQYPVLLAPLNMEDKPEVIDRKIRTVARFLDILLARRAVNYLSMTYGAMSYAVFLVMTAVRGHTLSELPPILKQKLDEAGCDFDGTKVGQRGGFSAFALNHWSKRYIKVVLARMIDHLEQQSGEKSHLEKYLAGGRSRFEVEHIWANHYERHNDEFPSEADFLAYRDRMGDLLLLPKSFNASYGDQPYRTKLAHYFGQNLLAKTLHPKCYEHHPQFLAYRDRSGIPFRAHDQFKKEDLDERHALYRQLADEIWNPERLSEVHA